MPVAIVVRTEGDQTIAQPLANPARADFAIVEAIYQPAASQPVNANEQAQQEAAE